MPVLVKLNKKVQAGNFLSAWKMHHQVMKMTPLGQVIENKGLRKKWVAEQVGIAPGTLSLIVSGKSEPTLRVAIKIARLLEMTVEELWGYLEVK